MIPEDEYVETNEDVILAQMEEVLARLETCKPNDRSELDRVYAVTITEMQKVWAWWHFAKMGLPSFGCSDNAGA